MPHSHPLTPQLFHTHSHTHTHHTHTSHTHTSFFPPRQVRADDPVPMGITRQYNLRVQDTQQRGAADYAAAQPTGADRYRFAGRPRNPGLRDDMPNVVMSELNSRLDPITANRVRSAHIFARVYLRVPSRPSALKSSLCASLSLLRSRVRLLY